MTDAGLIVIAAFVSPFRADRETARALFDEGEFLEVLVDMPAELAAERDTTGLYAKAHDGELTNLTGVDAAVRAAGGAGGPSRHDVAVDVEAAAERVLSALERARPAAVTWQFTLDGASSSARSSG